MRFLTLTAAMLLVSAGAMAADCNHPAPIPLSSGAGTVTVAGGAPTGTSDCYRLSARAEQNLSLTLRGAANDAVFSLYAPGWAANCDSAGDCDFTGDVLSDDNTTNWSDVLPASGDYLIVIDNSRSDSAYQLTVVVQ